MYDCLFGSRQKLAWNIGQYRMLKDTIYVYDLCGTHYRARLLGFFIVGKSERKGSQCQSESGGEAHGERFKFEVLGAWYGIGMGARE